MIMLQEARELHEVNVILQSRVLKLTNCTELLEEANHTLTKKCKKFDDMKRHTLHDKMRVSNRSKTMVDLALFTDDYYSPSEYLDSLYVPILMDFEPLKDDDYVFETTKHSKLYLVRYKEHTVCVKSSKQYSAEHQYKIIQFSGSHKCLPHCYGVAHFAHVDEDCEDMLVMSYHGTETFSRKYSSNQDRLKREASRAIEVLINIGSLLYHLHRRKIVHNNIRPENILCGDSENPYLVGFSRACPEPLCRPLNAKQLEGDTYAAPELHTGSAPSCMTDVYAYGQILSATLMVLGTCSTYTINESLIEKVKQCIHKNPHCRPQKKSFLTLISELICFKY